MKIEIDDDAIQDLLNKLKKELHTQYQGAKAGWFRNDKGKKPDPDNPDMPDVSEIALWNEFGTYNIEPRPFIRTAQYNANKRISNAIQGMLQDGTDMEAVVKRAAQLLGAELKTSITRGTWKENAPITIHGGWMHNKKTGKLFYVKGKKSSRPLVDTGNMVQSIHTGIIKNGIDIITDK